MEIKRAYIVLLDITGYTSFMRLHALSVIHAEKIVTELLVAAIEAARRPLVLNKLEGDAALFHSPADGKAESARDILGQVHAMFDAFREREAAIVSECASCACSACGQANQLKLKAIVHVGDVVMKRVQRFEEIAGQDVILAHRLLKNSIKANEYVLMTEAFGKLCGDPVGEVVEARVEECADIGDVAVRVYCPAVGNVRVERASFWRRARMTIRMDWYTLGRFLRKPAGVFRNIPVGKSAGVSQGEAGGE